MSADLSSSKVALKDSMSCVGNSDINPTVSENKTGPWIGFLFFLVTESNVANNWFSAFWLLSVSLLNRVVLPAFVYPTIATNSFLLFFLAYLFISLCLCDFSSLWFNLLILLPISLLSVSSWVSPGPLNPIPPFCLSRWVQPLISLVDRCFNWASSTWSLPMWDDALVAKISRINSVLSITLLFKIFSKFLACEADKEWLTITNSISPLDAIPLSNSNLPFEINVLMVGEFCFILISLKILVPEDNTKLLNSS